MRPRVLLVHGAATTAAVWASVRPLLRELELVVPDRPSSGNLDEEVDFLSPWAQGSLVVGASGGATLGLALAAGPVEAAGFVLHEPAVGSLAPGLLDRVVAGHREGGVEGFGRALYGPGWSVSMSPVDPGAVGRDLAMFRAFEPRPPRPGQGPVLVTVGGDSPPARHAAARALAQRMAVSVRVLDGCGHFVQHDHPAALAAVVRGASAAPRQPGRRPSEATASLSSISSATDASIFDRE